MGLWDKIGDTVTHNPVTRTAGKVANKALDVADKVADEVGDVTGPVADTAGNVLSKVPGVSQLSDQTLGRVNTAMKHKWGMQLEDPLMMFRMTRNLLTHPDDPKQTIQDLPSLARAPHTPAERKMQQMQAHRFLHAVENPERLKAFRHNKTFSAVDMDVRPDASGDKVVVSHDAGQKHAPAFKPWVKQFLDMPPDKVANLKIDVKDPRAIDQMIRDLKDLDPQNKLGRERGLVFNADIPLGSAHKDSKIQLADMKKLRQAFPHAVISLGLDDTLTQVDKPTRQAIARTLDELGGVNTVISHVTTPLDKAYFELLQQHNAYASIWANQAYRGAVTNKKLDSLIPEAYRDHIVLDF